MQEIEKAKYATFGFLRKIDRSDFIDAIDNEKPEVFVVIHYYQDYLPSCVGMNQALQSLAIKFPYVKFLKILATDASSTFDDIALPALSIYKGGNLQTALVRVTDSIGKTFDQDHVEELLRQHDVC